jgi:hypothetical protein
MIGKERLDKKNDDEYEAVNGKDSPNDADPVGNRFWHFHIGNDLRIYLLCEDLQKNMLFAGFSMREDDKNSFCLKFLSCALGFSS